MKSYIFITTEGYTFQQGSESAEFDIENCQVIGFAQGFNEEDAFDNLVKESPYLLDTTFDEVICMELGHGDYHKHSKYFSLKGCRVSKSEGKIPEDLSNIGSLPKFCDETEKILRPFIGKEEVLRVGTMMEEDINRLEEKINGE